MTSSINTGGLDKRLLRYLATAFVLYLVVAGLLGVLAIVLSAIWADATSDTATGPVITRDLGIALLISVFVTGSIELYAGRRLREQVATDVIGATFQTLIPAAIYREIRDSVLQSPVVRQAWEVDMFVVEPDAEPTLCASARSIGGNDLYLVDSIVAYELHNTLSKATTYIVSGGIDLDTPLADLGIPRFTDITIDDVHEQLDQELTKRVLADGPSVTSKGLTVSVMGSQLVFTSQQQIPSLGRVGVRFSLRRAFRAPGQIVLSATVPTEGFRFKIHGPQELRFDLTALHPNQNALSQVDSREWRFEPGILPWQGFTLRSRIHHPLRPASSETAPTRD